MYLKFRKSLLCLSYMFGCVDRVKFKDVSSLNADTQGIALNGHAQNTKCHRLVILIKGGRIYCK